jgi:hypothetical protein
VQTLLKKYKETGTLTDKKKRQKDHKKINEQGVIYFEQHLLKIGQKVNTVSPRKA